MRLMSYISFRKGRPFPSHQYQIVIVIPEIPTVAMTYIHMFEAMAIMLPSGPSWKPKKFEPKNVCHTSAISKICRACLRDAKRQFSLTAMKVAGRNTEDTIAITFMDLVSSVLRLVNLLTNLDSCTLFLESSCIAEFMFRLLMSDRNAKI